MKNIDAVNAAFLALSKIATVKTVRELELEMKITLLEKVNAEETVYSMAKKVVEKNRDFKCIRGWKMCNVLLAIAAHVPKGKFVTASELSRLAGIDQTKTWENFINLLANRGFLQKSYFKKDDCRNVLEGVVENSKRVAFCLSEKGEKRLQNFLSEVLKS